MFPNLWVSLIGGAALFLSGIGAGGYAVGVYKNGQIARIERDQAKENAARTAAELKQFTDIGKQINIAAQDFLSNQGLLGTKIDTITKDLKNVQAKRPLPPGCKPDADRMRNLYAAIDAANSVAGH